MQELTNILRGITIIETKGSLSCDVAAVCLDSRKVEAGSLFIAARGTVSDGHEYIDKAIEQGAVAIVCEVLPEAIHDNVAYVRVANAAAVAGLIADEFYGHPSRQMKVVGVTGTNGKTTTATLLYKMFEAMGHKCGLLSTVSNYIHDQAEVAKLTTPDAVSVHALLARMVKAGCTHAFMEVSSHAIHQHRIAGIRFAGGVFTNITHDHLDYHKTFEEYIRVKKSFIDNLPKTAFALTNADDKRGAVMLQNTKAQKNYYSLKVPATIKGKVLENSLTGLVMNVDNIETHFRLIGTFNAYNILAVYGVATLLGEDKLNTLAVLSGLESAAGRFETIVSPIEKVLGIVDYAHTPDALLNVLGAINQLRTQGQQLFTVVGCGGDRDKTKRPIMGTIACEHSDKAILTSDNPRTENPEIILDEMEADLSPARKRKSLRITDRYEAIKVACSLAHPGDILLVAGKGHEPYQEINGIRHHFDDKEVLTEIFELLNK